MRRTSVASYVLAFCFLATAASAQQGVPFQPSCPPPWGAIAKNHPIDTTCDRQGTPKASLPAAKRDANNNQNSIKNNLCAQSPEVELTFTDFLTLQKKADDLKAAGTLRFGDHDDPPPASERTVLTSLLSRNGHSVGEGSTVSLTAFIQRQQSPALPRYSNMNGGESVNCYTSGPEYNDIHMPLVPDVKAPYSTTVVSEVIPHQRPKAWEVATLKKVKNPVRITGQLFFDGSHHPDAERPTVWEIHPVYKIEICAQKTLAECQKPTASWSALTAP